jgi:predicted transcriptional regulator
MANVGEKLKQISDQIRGGIAPTKVRVRDLLWMFGVSRRGYGAVRRIRSQLEACGLETDPDFEYAYIGSFVSFIRAGSRKDALSPQETFRIGQLESANTKPVWIKPDNLLSEAVTIMMRHDYSQLPVMTTDRDLKGVVSWKTIGSKLALRQPCEFVRDCLEQPRVVGLEDSLFSAIRHISDFDYVLVRAQDRTICGIVTATDFSEQFRQLGEPFLLIAEIENGIRKIIHGKFTAVELSEVKNPSDTERSVTAVDHLTFGEYVRLLENEERWKKIDLALDRVEFVKSLRQIKNIRNDIMHFDPEGLDKEDLKILRDFAKFINRLRFVGGLG